MTIYINTFDTGEVCGMRTNHVSFKAAVSDLIDETGSESFNTCIRKDYISTVRLDECGHRVIELDLTDSAYKAAQQLVEEDQQNAVYDRQHNDGLRQPSSIA